MEVILLENIRKLGKIGEVVKVRNGFARNFLIPNQKAMFATEKGKTLFESKRAEIEKENKKKLDEASKVSSIFEGKIVTVIRQAGEDGRLYGSVSPLDIAKAISTNKAEINKRDIQLDKTIKSIGIYPVKLNLHSELQVVVQVNVARSDAEAKDAAAKFKRGEYVSPTEEQKKKSYEEILTETEEKLAVEQPAASEASSAE